MSNSYLGLLFHPLTGHCLCGQICSFSYILRSLSLQSTLLFFPFTLSRVTDSLRSILFPFVLPQITVSFLSSQATIMWSNCLISLHHSTYHHLFLISLGHCPCGQPFLFPFTLPQETISFLALQVNLAHFPSSLLSSLILILNTCFISIVSDDD